MKLSEILSHVDTMTPNSILAETKVAWINHVQNQLFRDHPIPEKVHTFSILNGQVLYPLPADCPEDRVREVVIEGENYPFMTNGPEPIDDNFVTIVNGQLLVYPEPRNNSTGVLFYKARPTQLSVERMEEESNFPADFHELLVLGCAYRVALATPAHANLVPVLNNDYQQLARKADLVLRRKMPRKVTIMRPYL